MNRRYNTPWWASGGDGPLGLGPENSQLNSKMKLLQRLCENGPLYAVESRYGGRKYGKVEVKDGRILINSFQLEEPDSPREAKYISLPELLSRFNNGSSELPQTVFLRLAPEGGREASFDVIIETEGLSLRAKNFIMLCSALEGPCYKECQILGMSTLYTMLLAPHIVFDGIRRDDPWTPWKEGYVYEIGGSCLIPLTDRPDHPPHPKFGVVVAGLQQMKDHRETRFYSEECGLVI